MLTSLLRRGEQEAREFLKVVCGQGRLFGVQPGDVGAGMLQLQITPKVSHKFVVVGVVPPQGG